MTRTRVGLWLTSAVVVAVAIAGPRRLAATPLPPAAAVPAADDITVRGCVERDAAATSPIFKLIVAKPAKIIYRLAAPKDVDLAAQVGHTVEILGVVSSPATPGRPEAELSIKKLTVLSASCDAPESHARLSRPR